MEYVIGRRVSLPGSVSLFTVVLSQFDALASITLRGVHTFLSYSAPLRTRILSISCLLCLLTRPSLCVDFTDQVFEGKPNGLLAAFGDFNSDKLTDAFVISDDQQSFSVLLAKAEPPYLSKNSKLVCHMTSQTIVSLVPGDFDGDAAMDVLILTSVTKWGKHHFQALIAWGGLTEITCPDGLNEPLLHVYGQPLVMDYNGDMIADLFGLDVDEKRQFWIFNSSRVVDHIVPMEANETLRLPHSHSFLDLDGDWSADLLLTGLNKFEIWRYSPSSSGGRFEFNTTIDLPGRGGVMGQSVFVDFDFDGSLDHLVPVCSDARCSNSTFYMRKKANWFAIDCDLRDPFGNQWTFHPPDSENIYLQAVTARSGDFNLDGYPDLLMTLVPAAGVLPPRPRVVFLENVPSVKQRKLSPRWDLLTEWNSSVMATFYDIQEKGALDVLLVHLDGEEHKPRMAAYKSSLDYDANFIKVLVLTGRCFANCSHRTIPYGTNLPGPCISYKTTQPSGEVQLSAATQLSQSAYSSLQLPYTLFGLARSPNFIETLHVGLGGGSREWTQIIPNSQMIIIPTMDNRSSSWLNKLFVTPSRAIVLSAAALAGFGFLLAVVVAILHCRERRADKLEQLAVTNRFHFDAM